MNRRLLIVGIALALVIFFLTGREMGLLRANLHSTSISSTQTFSHSTTRSDGGEGPVSFQARIRRRDRPWLEHTRVILRAPRIEIQGNLDNTNFSGNDWLPLLKDFTLAYECELTTPDDSPIQFIGTLQGDVVVRIQGLCSKREARRLALEEVREKIQTSLQKLNP